MKDLANIQEQSYAKASKSLLESYPQSRMMTKDELIAFLNSKRFAVLATARKDGRAHATPIGFLVWNGAFWIASAEGARSRNLQNNPWASIVVIEGESRQSPGCHRRGIC